MPRRKPDLLGTVTAPSSALFIVDMGMLNLWCHDRPPILPPGLLDAESTANANAGCDFRIDGPDAEKCGHHWDRNWHPLYHFDIPRHGIDETRKEFEKFAAKHKYNAKLTRLRAKITHRQRIANALDYGDGMGQVFFQGLEGFVLSGLPTDTQMNVVAERMGGRDSAIKDRWRWVDLEVRPKRKVTSSERVGHVFVDRARLMFADIDALGEWKHDEPIDGQADLVFWGRDAEQAAKKIKASMLPNTESDPVYGWENLPVTEADRKGNILWRAKEKHEWLMALDYRPHSHQWELMRQVRVSQNESGTIDVGGATMCGFMTSWGDGLFPVIVERDAGAEIVRVRLQLGDDDRVKLLYDVMGRSSTR